LLAGEEFRIGYRKGPGRAGGKLTRSILLNSSTIPKRKESGEVEERECSGGENEGESVSVTTAVNGVESVARVKSLVRTFDDLLGLLSKISCVPYRSPKNVAEH
jgi:hypothetical protein